MERLPKPSAPRRPEDNEIPGSSNILSSEGAAADIISPTSTKSETSRQQLNLGKLFFFYKIVYYEFMMSVISIGFVRVNII